MDDKRRSVANKNEAEERGEIVDLPKVEQGEKTGMHAATASQKTLDKLAIDREPRTSLLRDLWERTKGSAFVLAGVTLDLAFLTIWLFLQHLYHLFVLSNDWVDHVDKVTYTAFHLLFSGLTLFTVVVYIAKDVKRIWRWFRDGP